MGDPQPTIWLDFACGEQGKGPLIHLIAGRLNCRAALDVEAGHCLASYTTWEFTLYLSLRGLVPAPLFWTLERTWRPNDGVWIQSGLATYVRVGPREVL